MDTFQTNDDVRARNRSALFILLGILMVTVVFSFLPASWFGIKPLRNTHQRVDLSALSLDGVARDTDKDGSISWKELVTDSLSASDIAEMEKGEQIDPEVVANLNDPNNLTASFSKNLYTASAYLSKNQVSDPASQQDVVNQLIAQEASKITTKQYSLSDINVAKTESKESIKTYGNSVATILQSMISEKSITDDFSSVQGYIETQDKEALVPISKDYIKVKTSFDKLLSLSVPLSAATYHTMVLNRVGEYRDTLYNLSQIETDPMRAMLLIQKYPEITLKTLRIYAQLSNYFDTKNIVFTSKDPGYVFTVGYTLK